MEPRDTFSAVVFDLDGTLLDTIDDLADTGNHILSEEGLSPVPVALYRQFVGRGLRHLIACLLEHHHADALDIGMMTRRFSDEYLKRLFSRTKPYDGIEEMLWRLESAGVSLSVLSNKSDALVRELVLHYFPRVSFAAVMGASPVYPRKPAPDAAHVCARAMNCRPHETAFLGDSGIDMETARGSGMYAIGAGWGFRDTDELLRHGAARIVFHPLEVLPVILDGRML